MLAHLSAEDYELLAPHLRQVDLPLRKRLETRRKEIEHIYFPESGFLSVVSDGPASQHVEVGMIGREGMSGLAVLLGTDRSPNDTIVQHVGVGLRITAVELRKAMLLSAPLRRQLQLYVHSFLVQVTQTARANARNKIEERLARWLLMAHDRLGTDDLAITLSFYP